MGVERNLIGLEWTRVNEVVLDRSAEELDRSGVDPMERSGTRSKWSGLDAAEWSSIGVERRLIGLEWTRLNEVEHDRSGVDSIERSGARSEWSGTQSERSGPD
eukprot:1214131-Pleurochrysis_carterae.AAC.1